jgi:hypothetical protein
MPCTPKNGRDLIEQSGSHSYEPMLGALAELRDRERWQARIEEFKQEKSGRDSECSGTGQSAFRGQVPLDFGRKPVNRKTGVQ